MTAIDICNMALSALGHERTVAGLDEPGKEASLCRVWLDQARQSVLGAAWWPGLARVTPETDGAPDGAYFRYPAPACGQALRLEALAPDGGPADIAAADRGSLLLAIPRARFRYIADYEHPDGWPPGVRGAVAAELAALIAYALTGQRGTAADARARADAALARARAGAADLTRRHGEDNRYAAARRGRAAP